MIPEIKTSVDGSLLRFLAIDFFLFVIYFAAMASLVVVAGVSTAVESV